MNTDSFSVLLRRLSRHMPVESGRAHRGESGEWQGHICAAVRVSDLGLTEEFILDALAQLDDSALDILADALIVFHADDVLRCIATVDPDAWARLAATEPDGPLVEAACVPRLEGFVEESCLVFFCHAHLVAACISQAMNEVAREAREYRVLNTTDGIPADPRRFTWNEAERFIERFRDRFRAGGYTTAKGERITADEVRFEIVPVEDEEET